jgi:hypothetical protein
LLTMIATPILSLPHRYGYVTKIWERAETRVTVSLLGCIGTNPLTGGSRTNRGVLTRGRDRQ